MTDDPEEFRKMVGLFIQEAETRQRERIWKRLEAACRDDGTIRREDARKAVED